MTEKEKKLFGHISNVLNFRIGVAEILSKGINVPVDQIFYAWIRSEVSQVGELDNGWKYFFHGLDCTLGNDSTQEKCRLEFGPNGRVDCFTKSLLVDESNSDLFFSDNDVSGLFSGLEQRGLINHADASLYEKISQMTNNELDDYMESLTDESQMDTMVADRLALFPSIAILTES